MSLDTQIAYDNLIFQLKQKLNLAKLKNFKNINYFTPSISSIAQISEHLYNLRQNWNLSSNKAC